MRTFVQDPAVRASGRMRDYRGEPDLRIREIPGLGGRVPWGEVNPGIFEAGQDSGAQVDSRPPPLDVRDFGALGLGGEKSTGWLYRDGQAWWIRIPRALAESWTPKGGQAGIGGRLVEALGVRQGGPTEGGGVEPGPGGGAVVKPPLPPQPKGLRGRVLEVQGDGNGVRLRTTLAFDAIVRGSVQIEVPRIGGIGGGMVEQVGQRGHTMVGGTYEVEVWRDDSLPIQEALDAAGSGQAGTSRVWAPAGVYSIGTPWARDNLPLRLWSRTTLEGDGPGRTVLRLADEVNQIVDSTRPQNGQEPAATVLTNRGSGVYVFDGVGDRRAKLPPVDEGLTIRRLTLDGNRDGQRRFHTRGGVAEVWREAVPLNDPEIQYLSQWIDVKKLVRWGSGERSAEAVAVPEMGPLGSYWVAVSLVSTKPGKEGVESTATILPGAVSTVGLFNVVVHRLPTNELIDAQNPPRLRVYLAIAVNVSNTELDGRRYKLVNEVSGVQAGQRYQCSVKARVPGGLTPPGCLSLEAARTINRAIGAGSVQALGLQLDNVRQVLVEDVEIRDGAGGGLYLGSQAEGEARDVVLRRVDLHGYRWFAIALVYRIYNLTLEDCTIWDSDYGMDVEDVQQVVGLTLRRVAILECPGTSLQLVPAKPKEREVAADPKERFIRDVRLLGCALVGNQTHVIIGNSASTYDVPGNLDGLVIGNDDQAPHRPTLLAWARRRVLWAHSGARGGRVVGCAMRRNGFPKVSVDVMQKDLRQYISPRPPYYEAAPALWAGRIEAIVGFDSKIDKGRYYGPGDWTISGNTIEVNRFGEALLKPSDDLGTIWIAPGLEKFTVTANTLLAPPTESNRALVFVEGQPRTSIEVTGNRGPLGDWQRYFREAPEKSPWQTKFV